MPGFFKSSSTPRSLPWLWVTVMSTPAAVAAYGEAVPWTLKIACVMVAICCSLWLWLNVPRLKRRLEGVPPSSPEEGQEKTSTSKTAQAPAKQSAVAFQLVGNWHQGPFRLTKLREQRALPELYAEDLCLRITANKNLNKVYLIVKVLCKNALVREFSEFKILRGEVRKGAREEILIFRHTFERVPASYTDYSTNAVEYLLARRTIGKYFFPSTPASYTCPKDCPPGYDILIRVLHDNGHESVSLSIMTDAAPVPHSRVVDVADGIEILTDINSGRPLAAAKDARADVIASPGSKAGVISAKQSRN
jgi:hypothetical protein